MFPVAIAALDFKTKEELHLLPQTQEAHIDEMEDDGSSFNSDSNQQIAKIDGNIIMEVIVVITDVLVCARFFRQSMRRIDGCFV